MPRVVDEASRRAQLADAVWRLVRRGGIDQASVRQIAAEAGLAVGSVRHYFPAQEELHRHAMRAVVRRVVGRIRAVDPPADPAARAEWLLKELLPLDAERYDEAAVWLAYTARSTVDVRLERVRRAADRLLLALCRDVVRDLRVHESQHDLDHESRRLAGLLNGLSMEGTVRPGPSTAVRLRELLAGHVDELLAR